MATPNTVKGTIQKMSEHTEHSTLESEETGKLNLSVLVEQFLAALKRLWLLVLALTVLFAGASYFHVNRTYIPKYVAEATLAIYASKESQELGQNSYTNVTTAQQLGKVFPYILTSGILSDMVAEDLGTSSIPGQISVDAVEGTNLVTIQVTASDGQTAYDVLYSVIENYPQVAQFVIGQTEVTILDDSGVPSDSGAEYVSRGSLRKGAMMGFALGIALVLLRVLLRRTIRYPSDFKSLLHVPCLGTIPVYQEKKRRKNAGKNVNILSPHVPQDYLEAIQALRARIERKMEKTQQKTLLITSSIPEEGKSTIAANLAISFAKKGKRVVLVDCDLRHPSVQGKLGIQGTFPGLTAVLKGNVVLADALYQMPVEGMNLKVLCGAKNSIKEIEILGSNTMKVLLEHLEAMADIVILDTSPSSVLADALVLARNVSTALYVVRYDHAKVRHVLDGIEELAESKINIIGCVLNQGKYSSRGAGYGYQYGGYGKYRYGYRRSGYGSEK